jgi:NAD(P)H-dependent nitrite reductase small subunit
MRSTPTTAPEATRPSSQVPCAAWEEVCHLDDLPRERGAAALVDGVQVALFRTHDDAVHALQQYDPYCGAHVISRGIVGSRGGVPTVASPMYKQVFDLRTGACLDPVGREPVDLAAYATEVRDGVVFVSRVPLPTPGAP